MLISGLKGLKALYNKMEKFTINIKIKYYYSQIKSILKEKFFQSLFKNRKASTCSYS